MGNGIIFPLYAASVGMLGVAGWLFTEATFRGAPLSSCRKRVCGSSVCG